MHMVSSSSSCVASLLLPLSCGLVTNTIILFYCLRHQLAVYQVNP